MTLDEAIKHAEEVMEEKLYEYQECVAVHDTENATDCRECGEEHRQLAEWLKDYKRLLEQESKIGHWIMTSDYLTTAYGSVDYVKCSYCGEESLEEGDYCPNCGSFMKGEFE